MNFYLSVHPGNHHPDQDTVSTYFRTVLGLQNSFEGLQWVPIYPTPRFSHVLGQVLQRNSTNRRGVCVCKDIYYKSLAQVIRGAGQSQDLQPVNQRPQRARGVVPVQAGRPENQGNWWCDSSLRSGEPKCSSSAVRQAKVPHTRPFLVCLDLQLIRWVSLHWEGRSALFSPLIQWMVVTPRNTRTLTQQTRVWPRFGESHDPVRLTPNPRHHTILNTLHFYGTCVAFHEPPLIHNY